MSLNSSSSTAPTGSGGGVGARIASGSISMAAFERAGAVQGYFAANAEQRLGGGGRYAHLFKKVPSVNMLVSNLRATRLRDYSQQSAPFATIFLYPALVGFDMAGGVNGVITPLPADGRDLVWTDLATSFPLLIYGLVRSGMSGYTAVYAGHLTPAGLGPVFTYTDAELGTGWQITDAVMDNLDVLVPESWVLAAAMDQAVARVPSLAERFPAPGNASSKRIFVQEDGRDSWDVYVSDRPTSAQVQNSRVMYRSMEIDRFAYILNAVRSMEIDFVAWHARLISNSVLSSWELPVHCAHMNGLYNSKVKHMRIMQCPEALELFYSGKWPRNFQLHKLSLWHFMPTQSLGFDYTKSNGDVFGGLRGLLSCWSWLVGAITFMSLFEVDILTWQTTHPWSSTYVWVINVCLEKGIAAWFLYMSSPAEIFQYKNKDTAINALLNLLRENMKAENVVQIRDAYDAQYAPLVVYPNAHCSVPNEVSDIRGRALLDPQGLTEPRYVLPDDVAAFTRDRKSVV